MARRFKPRIVITIVSETSSWEMSIVKGREMADGRLCPGPTEKQIKIASKAILDLCRAEPIADLKNTTPPPKMKANKAIAKRRR